MSAFEQCEGVPVAGGMGAAGESRVVLTVYTTRITIGEVVERCYLLGPMGSCPSKPSSEECERVPILGGMRTADRYCVMSTYCKRCVAVGEDVSIELICEVLRPVYTSLCGKQDAVVHDSAVVSSSSGHVLRPARNPAMGAARGAWESDMTAHERSWIVLRVREASFSYVEDMHRLRYGHTLDWKEQEYERSSMDELADLLSCYCKSFFLTSLNHPPVLYVRRGNYAFISQP